MRLLALGSLSCLFAAALAQSPFPGTKPDVARGNTTAADLSSPGLMPLVQMALVAGIVLLVLKVVLPKFASKLNKKLQPSVGGGIRIEESATFAGGSLFIVSARGRTLLLSVSGQGVSCLSDLSSAARDDPQPVFMDLLEDARAGRVDAPGYACVQSEFAPESDDVAVAPDPSSVEAALRRARELSS